jgi:hypothetical protein
MVSRRLALRVNAANVFAIFFSLYAVSGMPQVLSRHNGREHLLGIGDRDLILKLHLSNTDPRSLDGDRRDVKRQKR